MNRILRTEWERLQENRNVLFIELGSVSIERLELSPNNAWSVAQVFYHLNTAEKLSILYVKKKMQGGKALPSPGILQGIKLWYAGVRFKSGRKYKAPRVLGDVPSHVSYPGIVAEWDKTRKDLEELLKNFPPDLFAKSVFKQPAIGYLNLVQMLQFMNMHADKHYRQIRVRLKNS